MKTNMIIEITRPVLILGVGSAGLVMNVVGLLLFHDAHGHGHHHHGHSHSHGPSKKARVSTMEQGNSTATITPQPVSPTSPRPSPFQAEEDIENENAEELYKDLYSHPVKAKMEIIRTAKHARTSSAVEIALEQEPVRPHERLSLELHKHSSSQSRHSHSHSQDHQHKHDDDHKHDHDHGEGKMNMHGVFLHLLGDALGSIGVIVSGLVIWLATGWENRFIIDPIISIMITTLIVVFTVPLIRSASLILMQAAPPHLPMDDVRHDILQLPGIISFHELHVWQLSDTKLVASVHVRISPDVDVTLSQRRVQALLHAYGIHSSTVQPEVAPMNKTPSFKPGSGVATPIAEEDEDETACLLRCADAAREHKSLGSRRSTAASLDCEEQRCCPSPKAKGTS